MPGSDQAGCHENVVVLLWGGHLGRRNRSSPSFKADSPGRGTASRAGEACCAARPCAWSSELELRPKARRAALIVPHPSCPAWSGYRPRHGKGRPIQAQERRPKVAGHCPRPVRTEDCGRPQDGIAATIPLFGCAAAPLPAALVLVSPQRRGMSGDGEPARREAQRFLARSRRCFGRRICARAGCARERTRFGCLYQSRPKCYDRAE